MPVRSPAPQTEQLLVEALQSDKNAAFATLYTAYASALRAGLVKMVVDKASADDLLQDVFLRIWINFHRYNADQGRLFTWLLTITRNVARDELNSRRRHRAFRSYSQCHMLQKEDVQHPASVLYQPLFESIAPKYRQVIEFTCRGYTQEEIARLLSLPLGTVKTRYRTGMQKLKLLFSQDIYYYRKCR